MSGCLRLHSSCLNLSKGRRGGGSIGTLWASSAAKLLVVTCAADRQLDILRRCGMAQLRFIFSDDLGAAGVLPRRPTLLRV